MLFKSSKEIKEFLPANAEFEYESIRPFIETHGENVFLRKYTGDTLMGLLQVRYNENNLSGKWKELLRKVQMPLAFYSFLRYMSWGMLNITKGGILQSGDDKKKNPFPWQINGLKRECIEGAYIGVEELLRFLEGNRSDGYFALWTGSTGDTFFNELLIRTVDEFNEIYDINSSRRTFHSLRPLMREIEKRVLIPRLSNEFVSELKTQGASTLSEANKKIYQTLKDALAHLCISKACQRLPIIFNDDGLQLISSGETDKLQSLSTQEQERRSDIIKTSEEAAEDFLKQINDTLYAAPDDYPTWKASSAYVAPENNESSDQSDNAVVAF
jgi:hypothetical protein